MQNKKTIGGVVTGSLSSTVPVLLACCKSTACVGVCATPVASLFGISAAGIATSPVFQVIEPLLIAISAVAFTVSWYSLYVLPRKAACDTDSSCACAPEKKPRINWNSAKVIFWVGLILSISFFSYSGYEKYQALTEESSCCESD
jgi:hypothetical protein